MNAMRLQAESAALRHYFPTPDIIFGSGLIIILLIMIVGTILCIGIAVFALRWQRKKLREENEENSDETRE